MVGGRLATAMLFVAACQAQLQSGSPDGQQLPADSHTPPMPDAPSMGDAALGIIASEVKELLSGYPMPGWA